MVKENEGEKSMVDDNRTIYIRQEGRGRDGWRRMASENEEKNGHDRLIHEGQE